MFKILERDIYYFTLLLISISIPYNRNISSILTGFLILNWLISGNFNIKLRELLKNKFVFLFCSIFGFQVIGLLYSENLTDGFFTLEKTISLLIFPIIISTSPSLSNKQIKSIFAGFIWSCVGGIIFCLIFAIYKNYSLQNVEWLLYTRDLLIILNISHVYFGMYLVFAFFLSFDLIVKNSSSKILKTIYLLRAFIIIVGILLLIPKTAIVALIFISVLMLSFMKRRQVFKFWLIFAPILIVLLIAGLKIPNIKYRIMDYAIIFSSFSDISNDYWDYKSSRLGPTMCSFQIIKENIILGVGTGDARNEMEACFIRNDLSNLIELNSHNQYLHYMLSLGIPGLLCFVGCLFNPLIISLRKGTIIYTIFLLLFIICNLTENMMLVNKGIVFYSFFNSLLAFTYLRNQQI